MNGIDIKRGYLDQLAQEILDQPPDLSPATPLHISPQVTVSLLQKAIRRGEHDLAHQAAVTLLAVAPDRFWRRCVVIAAEEVGVADTKVVALVTAAATVGKSWREKHGGEQRLVHAIVSMMVRADKCRSADDLAIVAAWHPALAGDRVNFAEAPTRDLLALAAGSSPITRRALALWYLDAPMMPVVRTAGGAAKNVGICRKLHVFFGLRTDIPPRSRNRTSLRNRSPEFGNISISCRRFSGNFSVADSNS